MHQSFHLWEISWIPCKKLSWPLSSLQNICWYLKNNLETILLLEKKWEDTQKLKVLCETCWAFRADWLAVFVNAFKVIIDTLDQLSEEEPWSWLDSSLWRSKNLLLCSECQAKWLWHCLPWWKRLLKSPRITALIYHRQEWQEGNNITKTFQRILHQHIGKGQYICHF